MAVGLASCLAEREPCWLVDVHGGAAAVLGVDRMPVGLAEWSAAPEAPDDALTRLTREVAPGLGLLGPGSGAVGPELDVRRLRAELVTVGPTVIVDVGTHPAAAALVAVADRSTLVLRNCAAAVATALDNPIVADDALVIMEPGRSLRARDVERALGVPITTVPFDPAMGGAVDVGLAHTGVPRRLARALRAV